MKIEKDQVMLAHRNGAIIHLCDYCSDRWVINGKPVWNWGEFQYRIGNQTKNGLRLDELAEKYTRVILLDSLITTNRTSNWVANDGWVDIEKVIEYCLWHPECIEQVDIKEQEKKLRPFNETELRQLVGECIATHHDLNYGVFVVTGFDGYRSIRVGTAWYTADALLKGKWIYNGNPCGILE